MAHIAIISVGISSYLNASFAFAGELKVRGHQITFVSAEPRAKQRVAEQGFDFRLLADEADLERKWRQSGLLRQPIYKRLMKRRAFVRARRPLYKHLVESREIDTVLADLKPDLLLLDSELYHHIIAVAQHDLPTLLLETHFAAPRAPGVPILYSDFVPKGTVLDRPLAAATWGKAMTMRHGRFFWERFFYGGLDRISTLRTLAQKRRFDWGKHVVMDQWRLLTFRHVDTLYMAASELDFPRPMESSTSAKAVVVNGQRTQGHFVGPMVLLDRAEVQEPRYVEVMNALRAKRKEQGDRPLVFCGMGSIFSDFDYFQRVIAAAALHPEWDLILAVGRRLSIEKFGAVPENVHLFQTVPQLDLLKRADVMLNHGGIGSIRESIFLGVPMLIYSHGHLDQPGCAARVVYHGVGLRGDIRREQPAEIAAKIKTILTDDSFRTNVEKMRTYYQAYGGAKTVVTTIEEMIR